MKEKKLTEWFPADVSPSSRVMSTLPHIWCHKGIWYVSTPARYTAAYSRNYLAPALCFVDRLNSGAAA